MSPLDMALIVERSSNPRELPRNVAGCFVADGTSPSTWLTREEYDVALKLLDYRERAAAQHARGAG